MSAALAQAIDLAAMRYGAEAEEDRQRDEQASAGGKLFPYYT